MYYTTFDNNNYIKLSSINDIYNFKNHENVNLLTLEFDNITYLDKNIFNKLTNLQELFLYNNNLSHLDKDVFKNLTNLKILSLRNNNLTTLDKDIFNNITNLESLNLSYNNLTTLDKNIFNNLTNLQVLHLSYNNITSLTKDIFNNLTNLQTLYLSGNELTSLDKDIFNNLTNIIILDLSHNKLTTLNNSIFNNITNLHELYIFDNKLTNLPKDIFYNLTNLLKLYLYNNELTTIPSSIIYCRRLRYFTYSNNEINYIPPNIQRFLNNLMQKSNKLQIYNDLQNVHNHHIQECIKTSLENILSYPKTINKDKLIQFLIDSKMNDRSLSMLLEYLNENSVHSVLNITFEEALLHILEYVKLELRDNTDNILKILEVEILDSECKCFTGRISRLINCLNGFTPLVKVEIPENMAISNIIIMVKQSYKGDDINELKTITKKELLDRGYDNTIINEYIEYIDI